MIDFNSGLRKPDSGPARELAEVRQQYDVSVRNARLRNHDAPDWPQEQRASIPPRHRDGPYGTETHIRIEDAQDKALAAFWRGVVLGAAVGALLAWCGLVTAWAA